jgi:hypothetical protein
MIEFAIILPVLMMVILAIAEFGLGFKDWLSITHASREGVRIGATAGNDASADIAILDSIEKAMAAENMNDLVGVTVANPDNMSEKTTYVWNGGSPCHWSPCPDPAQPTYIQPAWNPASRKISTPTERIEVSIEYRHEWLTGMFTSGPTDWTRAVVMDIEPQVFGS